MAKKRSKKKVDDQRDLVIVESPAKARTIANILGDHFEVKASVGHVRDLPKSDLGVDIENQFKPKYIIPKDKKKAVKEIQQSAAKAGIIYLATDPDREGEAIAWHLLEATGLKGRDLRRVVFHAITVEAVKEAFENPRDIDMRLVDAQQARRVVDRLVGYRLSPFLWKKVRRGLSAGRVQSVALRLVAERESEINSFVTTEYWSIDAALAKTEDKSGRHRFRAKLHKRNSDGGEKLKIGSEGESEQLCEALRQAEYRVLELKKRRQVRRPAPPYITSTLQQEASRRLGFSARRTMALAQQLYEGIALGSGGEVGLITYMRTDSTQVDPSVQREARLYVEERFGKDYIPKSPRHYGKKVKLAQEAHEAIRPTSVRRDPDAMRAHLAADQYKLYSLIWTRFLVSQMADAVYSMNTVEIEANDTGKEGYLMRATSTQMLFAGFREIYSDENEDEESKVGTNPLPPMDKGDSLRLMELFPDQHFTEPPPRYSEGTLVKTLEEKGVGRPSTYAPIMGTIQERGYVEKTGRNIRPTELGVVVNKMLTDHFPDFVDVGFTAEMEENLDEIARGHRAWQPVVQEFYRPLEEAVAASSGAEAAREETDEECELCKKPMVIRWGRRGRFLACSGFPDCRNSRSLDGDSPEDEQTDETCPECESPMIIKSSRFGRFLACSSYPKCKGRKPLVAKTGVPCPLCGGDIVEKRSRKGGRRFYGCNGYPDCKFTAWSKPISSPCPNCKGLLLSSPKGAKCSQCDWTGETPEPIMAGGRVGG